MNRTPGLSPRVQAALILALAVMVGALAGVLTERVVAQQTAAAVDTQQRAPARRDGRPAGRRGLPFPTDPRVDARYGERLGAYLSLTAEQHAAIDSLMAGQRRRVRELTREIEPQFRRIAEETRSSVDSILTLEQREQLRALRTQRQEQARIRQRPR